jgi:hypothetical protein
MPGFYFAVGGVLIVFNGTVPIEQWIADIKRN